MILNKPGNDVTLLTTHKTLQNLVGTKIEDMGISYISYHKLLPPPTSLTKITKIKTTKEEKLIEPFNIMLCQSIW